LRPNDDFYDTKVKDYHDEQHKTESYELPDEYLDPSDKFLLQRQDPSTKASLFSNKIRTGGIGDSKNRRTKEIISMASEPVAASFEVFSE